jgi:hypothetical protein
LENHKGYMPGSEERGMGKRKKEERWKGWGEQRRNEEREER